MIVAETLVDLLLDANTPLLLAMGPRLPKEGYLMGAPAFGQLFKRFISRAKLAIPYTAGKAPEETINDLITRGYSFMTRDEHGEVFVYGDPEQMQSPWLKKYFQLTPDATVQVAHDLNSAPSPMSAGALMRGKAGEDHDKTALLSFGGFENPPGGTYLRTHINQNALVKGTGNGLRYVIQHPGSTGLIFVTADRKDPAAQFSKKELGIIQHKFNISDPNTPVSWYSGGGKVPDDTDWQDVLSKAP